MIRCKLVEYTNPDATQTGARVDRAVSGETLGLGRAASCKIYLPDPRVRLEHASIARAEGGFLHLEAAGPVFVNERPQTNTRLAMGQKITIGPYDFVVENVEDGPNRPNAELTLSFAQRSSSNAQSARDEAQAAGGLRPSWVTRRGLAWVLSLAVILFGAALPIWNAFHPQPPPAHMGAQVSATADLQAPALEWVQANTARLDTFWNPGQISSAHRTFAQDCRACHDRPFERVADTACAACHKNTGAHVPDKIMDLEAFRGQRCASCHKEHQGQASMRTVDAIGCEQCHGNVKAFSPQTRLPNISDFATEHPAFRLSVRQPGNPPTVQRMAPGASVNASYDTGLKFPHALHLAKAGIKSPVGPAATGGRVTLACASCHALDAAGVRYEPVRMDRSCQGCHRLSVDPQAPERQVPHARPEVVTTAVREIYASLAVDRFPVSLVTVNSLLQRPNPHNAPGISTNAGRWVQEQSKNALTAMFEKPTGVCKTCHDIEKPKDASGKQTGWQVRPVVTTGHWLPKSSFSHAQHKDAACTSCHNAEASRSASDILIPDIETCRTCHAGAQARQDKIVSRCDSCHGFHARTEHPLFTQRVAAQGKKP